MAWNVGEKKGDTKRSTANKVTELRPAGKDPAGETATEVRARADASRNRDLAGGMEMLDLEFLLSIIEPTKGNDRNDVSMRKLGFSELLRRELVNEIDSSALKVYAMDENKFYGKDIQCGALKELTIRTARKSK